MLRQIPSAWITPLPLSPDSQLQNLPPNIQDKQLQEGPPRLGEPVKEG